MAPILLAAVPVPPGSSTIAAAIQARADRRARLSIIVPAYNCAPALGRCLDAITACGRNFELIVVDDASTDGTVDAASSRGVAVVRMPRNGGPGAARNRGAEVATGDVLVFVDSDVVVAPDAIARIRRVMSDEPGIAALFGSYDDAPAAREWVSTYRNLLHHYVHQHGNRDASTFWAGLGAVRRAAFAAVGGFDVERFDRPSIEDIELGYRLRAAGYRIRLDPDIQGKHLKRWTFKSVVMTDVLRRAVPWGRLILSTGTVPNDLNLGLSQRLSAVLAVAAVSALPFAVAWTPALAVSAACLVGLLSINFRLYAFFVARRGVAFGVACVALHWLYLVYSAMSYAFVHFEHLGQRVTASKAAS